MNSLDLVFATTDKNKFRRFAKFLREVPYLRLLSLEDLNVLKKCRAPFLTAEENAFYKAKYYSIETGKNVLSIQKALYVDFLPQDKQPGIFLRRINDKTDCTNEEMLNFWKEKIRNIPWEQRTGRWIYALSLITPFGKHYQSCSNMKFRFINRKNSIYNEKRSLNSMTIMEGCSKPYNEMTEREALEFDLKFITELFKVIPDFIKDNT